MTLKAGATPGGRRAGRRHRRVAALAAAGLVAATLMAGQLAGGSAEAAGSGTTTLTVPADTQMTTFNPFLSYYDGELNVIGAIYPSLTMLDDNGEPVPYLADSWATSSDQLTWTFTLHSGLKWSDGEPLTAADAAWTFNLIMHNPVAATSNGSLVANFKSVTAPDDTTLVITTKKPQANMLYLSVPVSGIPIVPEHIWKDHVADLKNYRNMDLPVVGYGPFTLTGFKTNQYAEMTANKDFFLGAPHYDKVVTNYYSNSDAQAAALTSGELDQVGGLTPAQFNAMSSKSDVMTYQTQSSGWTAIEINPGAMTRSGKPLGTGNPILKDIRVRQAIALGINRPELVKKVLGRQRHRRCRLPAARLSAVLLEALVLRGARLRPEPGQAGARRRRLQDGLERRADRTRRQAARVPAGHPLRRRDRRRDRAVPRRSG